jgi:hypothetical protein
VRVNPQLVPPWECAKENPLRPPMEGKQRGVDGRKILGEDEPVPLWVWSRDCVCPVERDVHGLHKILGFEQHAVLR